MLKINKHNQITGFKWLGDITIEENGTYGDVMEKLSSDITKEQDT